MDTFTLRKLCEREWPTFEVGWRETGSFDLGKRTAVHDVVFGDPGHPDQMAYIEIWMGIVQDQPKYLRECEGGPKRKERAKKGSRVFVTRSEPGNRLPRKPTAPVLPETPESPPRVRKLRNENPPTLSRGPEGNRSREGPPGAQHYYWTLSRSPESSSY